MTDTIADWLNPKHTLGELNLAYTTEEHLENFKELLETYTDPNVVRLSLTAVAEYESGEVLIESVSSAKTKDGDRTFYGEGTVIPTDNAEELFDKLDNAISSYINYTGEYDESSTEIHISVGGIGICDVKAKVETNG